MIFVHATFVLVIIFNPPETLSLLLQIKFGKVITKRIWRQTFSQKKILGQNKMPTRFSTTIFLAACLPPYFTFSMCDCVCVCVWSANFKFKKNPLSLNPISYGLSDSKQAPIENLSLKIGLEHF